MQVFCDSGEQRLKIVSYSQLIAFMTFHCLSINDFNGSYIEIETLLYLSPMMWSRYNCLQRCLLENVLNSIVKIGYQVANGKALNNYCQAEQSITSYYTSRTREMLCGLYLALEALPELMLTRKLMRFWQHSNKHDNKTVIWSNCMDKVPLFKRKYA